LSVCSLFVLDDRSLAALMPEQVTPQICIPWTADLAPSNRRARAMSITLSGLISGLVLGRVLAGIISNFASWRDTFWMAVGLQAGPLSNSFCQSC